jgi:hypothetical protein
MTTITTYEPCAECGAPLDDHQRYCVECGTGRRHPGDHVARYFAAAATARRALPVAERPVATRSPDHRWLAAALALLPVAAAIGVMVGHHDSTGSDARLLAALHAQGSVAGGSAASAAAAPASAATIASDFTLAKGYVVRLTTLPGGSDRAAVAKAEHNARAKGAGGVGVINPADFTLRPASGGRLVLYAGQYRTRSEAARALAKLRHRFPTAAVVAVKPAAGAAGKGAAGAASSATVAAQEHPTAAQKVQGAKIVQQIQATKGKTYVQQQRKLPDTIVVP